MARISLMLQLNRMADTHDPGHVVVGWELEFPDPQEYRGFVFSPVDLPEEYRHPSRWREYLFDNTVPGYVIDETDFAMDFRLQGRDFVWRLEWMCPAGFVSGPTELGPSLYRYSFNPNRNSCHNCVTWATLMVNSEVGEETFPSVREGRIKLALEQMLRLGAKSGSQA